jgi:two-component system chemotaxis response regulator CheB
MVVVGASAGGVEALSNLLSDLPSEIPIAFFVVLHVPPRSQSRLPLILERTARLPAEHPRDGEKIRLGRIYVAPPDFHLIVGKGVVRLNHDLTEHYNRPAIDPLFCSAAQVYGRRVAGVLLSGTPSDGVAGLKEIKRHGGLVIVQDPAEAGFPAMPRNALAKVEVDYCLPVTKIRDLVTRWPDRLDVPMGEGRRLAPPPSRLEALRLGYSTGQNVGAILDTSSGWGVYGRPSRVSDLERELSKHLVVRLTNAVTSMDICVAHLRRPISSDGIEKQKSQCRALLRWAMRHLSGDLKANVVILGDFNEGHPIGSDSQALDVLFQAKPPLVDALGTLSGKITTHTDGKAYDRILVSDAIAKGLNRLKLERVVIQQHRHGKGEERRIYTDHFPVVAVVRLGR